MVELNFSRLNEVSMKLEPCQAELHEDAPNAGLGHAIRVLITGCGFYLEVEFPHRTYSSSYSVVNITKIDDFNFAIIINMRYWNILLSSLCLDYIFVFSTSGC